LRRTSCPRININTKFRSSYFYSFFDNGYKSREPLGWPVDDTGTIFDLVIIFGLGARLRVDSYEINVTASSGHTYING